MMTFINVPIFVILQTLEAHYEKLVFTNLGLNETLSNKYQDEDNILIVPTYYL